jgi:hypothetical protein
MIKLIVPILFMGFILNLNQYQGSSMAPVVLAGSVVKNIGNEVVKKYPRKQCPVCKGSGKYLSGDGIKMVDCGYCIVDTKSAEQTTEIKISKPSSFCKCSVCKCKNCGCYP